MRKLPKAAGAAAAAAVAGPPGYAGAPAGGVGTHGRPEPAGHDPERGQGQTGHGGAPGVGSSVSAPWQARAELNPWLLEGQGFVLDVKRIILGLIQVSYTTKAGPAAVAQDLPHMPASPVSRLGCRGAAGAWQHGKGRPPPAAARSSSKQLQ